MTTMISTSTSAAATRPVVHELTGPAALGHRPADRYEVRPVTLTAAAGLLGTPVATFEAVQVAAAIDDLRCCPLCMRRPRRDPDRELPKASSIADPVPAPRREDERYLTRR